MPADDDAGRLVRLANPLSETAPYLRTTLLPGLLAAVTRNTSREQRRPGPLRVGSVFCAEPPAAPAPRPPVTQRPTDAELAAIDAALGRAAAAPRGGADRAAGARPAGPARRPRAGVAARGRLRRDRGPGRRSGRSVRRAAERAPVAPRPVRRTAAGVDGVVIGYAGELHPSVCAAYGLPARTAAAEIDLDALIAAAPAGGDVAPTCPRFPVAKEDVALIVDADVPVEAVRAALSPARASCWSRSGCSTSTAATRSGPARSRWPTRCASGPPTAPSPTPTPATARDAAVAAAAEATGAVQRTE